ncbi:MAG: hypothetical protein IE909_19500, partial [Campylobacterales bacterium]|nr:hypothetical protein [Campylobacterales bacterium]
HICPEFNRSQKLFFVGGLFLISMAFFWPFSFFLEFANKAFVSALVAMLLLFAVGIISDLLYMYSKIWSSYLGKGVVLLIYALLTTFAIGMGSQVVNEIVRFNSEELVRSTTFATIILFPVIAFFVLSIIFGIFFVFGQIYLVAIYALKPLKDIKCFSSSFLNSVEKYHFQFFFVRVLVYPVVFGVLFGLLTNPLTAKAYDGFVKQKVSWFIYNFEAQEFSRCKVPANSRVIPVNDDEIILSFKSGASYKFKPEHCKPVLEKTVVSPKK